MNAPIIFITKAMHHFEYAKSVFKRNNVDIPVLFGENTVECGKIIKDCVGQGTKVVITFDYLTNQLRPLFSVPFIEVRRSPSLFVQIILDLFKDYDRIALVAKDNNGSEQSYYHTSLMESSHLFPNGTRAYTISDYERDVSVLNTICKDGFTAVIGPHIFQERAIEMGLDYRTVPLSDADLLDSVKQARYQLSVYEQHMKNESLINTILNISDQGAVALDASGTILHINTAAKSIFSLLKTDPVGLSYSETPLGKIKAISDVLMTHQPVNSLVEMDGSFLRLSITPVFLADTLSNIIITCETANQIQSKDINVRTKLLAENSQASKTFKVIVGNSPAIARSISVAKRYAYYDSTILITAPSGCGKEVFAQSIHNLSRRKDKPFVVINCGALPESILESILFGYEPGTFTGAKAGGKAGLFELAHGGTVFLDEISEMPYSMQSRFLRVIQEREVMRVGSDQPIPVDFRIIAATNRNLWEMVENHTFREDLYHRISVLLLEIPPLDERKEDIEPLSRFFLAERSAQLHIPMPVLSNDALLYLKQQSYRGNVRQLDNILERAMILAPSTVIDTDIVKLAFGHSTGALSSCTPKEVTSLKEKRLADERDTILKALQDNDNNRKAAADALGISTTTLWRKMTKFKIK